MGFLEDMNNAFDPNKNGVANAFDPNKNGVADAFDPNKNGVANALDPNKNGVANFFNNDVKNALEPIGKTLLPLVMAPLKILGNLPVVGPMFSPLFNMIPGFAPPRPGSGQPQSGAQPTAPDNTVLLVGGGLLAILLLR